MMRFDRMTLGRQAKELGFVRDTFVSIYLSKIRFHHASQSSYGIRNAVLHQLFLQRLVLFHEL